MNQAPLRNRINEINSEVKPVANIDAAIAADCAHTYFLEQSVTRRKAMDSVAQEWFPDFLYADATISLYDSVVQHSANQEGGSFRELLHSFDAKVARFEYSRRAQPGFEVPHLTLYVKVVDKVDEEFADMLDDEEHLEFTAVFADETHTPFVGPDTDMDTVDIVGLEENVEFQMQFRNGLIAVLEKRKESSL